MAGTNRDFIFTKPFAKDCKALGIGPDEYEELAEYIREYAHNSIVVQGTGGVRKLRIALGQGKSG